MEYVYLSQAGYDKMKAELDNLIGQRPEIAQKIETARAHGDLKENAEYDAARQEQGLTEARIGELQDKLGRSKIIDDAEIPNDAIYIGATVTLKDLDLGKDIIYSLVSEDEADIMNMKIAVTSPVGKALLGHKIGDQVEVQVPARLIRYEVLKIER